MAKYKNPYKGKNITPSGVLPEDLAVRHNLVGASTASDKTYRKTYRADRKVKRMFEQVKRYRQTVHGVHENRLASTLRDAVHYLIEPMSRGNGGQGTYSTTAAQDTDDTLTSVQTPLKV